MSYDLPAPGTPVAEWTLAQCAEYVSLSDESYGERSAEAGSGAMSLGYGQEGAYEAANAVSRPESDPDYVEARRRLKAAAPAPAAPAEVACNCDAPFDRCSHGLGDIPF